MRKDESLSEDYGFMLFGLPIAARFDYVDSGSHIFRSPQDRSPAIRFLGKIFYQLPVNAIDPQLQCARLP